MAHVTFQNVSKTFIRQSSQFVVKFFLDALRGRRKAGQGDVHAVTDVSFDIRDGQSMGIVGHNGAGKSTLLNLVAGLTAPDAGTVSVEGRLMALLELGAGFHPDLTGLENLRMNASLCGFTRKETDWAQDQIVDFAELQEFIREPLRTYSAGMILRLAFSIAVHVEPDILLLDEVLAVGDKDFQQKCHRRIFELRDRGTILLCVSHVPTTLHELCDRGLWIEKGKVQMEGPAAEVFDAYMTRPVSAESPA
jgi:ABC-type polysaccharide/polyol phosphate transport system ATPase subunit